MLSVLAAWEAGPSVLAEEEAGPSGAGNSRSDPLIAGQLPDSEHDTCAVQPVTTELEPAEENIAFYENQLWEHPIELSPEQWESVDAGINE